MGCWDIYCFVCGNTCHSSDIDITLENYKNKNKLNKLIKKIKEINKITKWMNKCSMLLVNNKVVHNLKEINCNVGFCDKKGNHYEHLTNLNNIKENSGIFLHTDCYKYVKLKFGIQLKFKDIPLRKIYNHDKLLPINYGKIENYYKQYFNFFDVVKDNNSYLCYSPLMKEKNINQINKNSKALKIKINRPSPSVSATYYEKGDYKIGNNGKIWVIQNGKWIELKLTLVKKTIEIKIDDKISKIFRCIKNISYCGMYSKNPIFLLNKTKRGKINKYVVLTTEDYAKKLKL